MVELQTTVRRGRLLLLVALALGLGTEILQPVFAFTGIDSSGDGSLGLNAALFLLVGILLRLTIVILLFVETFRGRVWARWALGLLYVVAAVLRAIPGEGSTLASLTTFDWTVIVLYALVGLTVLAAPPIRAYQAAMREREGT